MGGSLCIPANGDRAEHRCPARPTSKRGKPYSLEGFRRGRLIRRVAIHAITSGNERREFVLRVAGIEVPGVANFLRDEGNEVPNRLAFKCASIAGRRARCSRHTKGQHT